MDLWTWNFNNTYFPVPDPTSGMSNWGQLGSYACKKKDLGACLEAQPAYMVMPAFNDAFVGRTVATTSGYYGVWNDKVR